MESTGRRAPRPATGGFTLVELMAVAFVVAILSALALPTLRWLGDLRSTGAALQVRGALVHAQEWALSTGERTWVQFDPHSGILRAFRQSPTSTAAADRIDLRHPFQGGKLEVSVQDHNQSFQVVDLGGTFEVMFDPDGVPHHSAGQPFTQDGHIQLSDGTKVVVTRQTGLVRIE